MLKRSSILLTSLFLFIWSAAHASEKPKMTAQEFEASLKFRQGEIVLPGGMATLKIPDSFRYLDANDTERVLVDAWGNPAGKKYGGPGFLGHEIVLNLVPKEKEHGRERKPLWCSGGRA